MTVADDLRAAADLIDADSKTIFGKSVPSRERVAARLRANADTIERVETLATIYAHANASAGGQFLELANALRGETNE